MNFKSFPEIKTERLLLRKIEASDSDEILFLRSDTSVNKFIERPENRKTKNKTDAVKFIYEINESFKKNKSITWGITLKNDSKIIGTICLWNFSKINKTAEIGYDLAPKYHGKGIMNEALKMIIDFGFKELKLYKIEALTHVDNENSRRLLENNGFLFIKDRKDIDNESNIIFELENACS
jgi:ribosomal-protein-alanine N-acetyltransferase